VARWLFGSSRTADKTITDVSGSQMACRVGNAAVISGVATESLVFDGLSDHLVVVDDIGVSDVRLPKECVSLSAWVVV